MTRTGLCFIAFAGAASAQPASYLPYEAAFMSCLASQGPTACQRRVAEQCMEAEDGGHTTFGMSACLGMEAQLWSFAISREFTRATHALRAQDAEHRAFFGERHSGASEALAASQALWYAWSVAECTLASEEWGAGSHRHIAYGDCILTLSSQRLDRLQRIEDRMSE